MKVPFGMLILSAVLMSSCKPLSQQSVQAIHISDIRLGDGVPLEIMLHLRTHITDRRRFSKIYEDPNDYHLQILTPRCTEYLSQISHRYESVDSVFGSQREEYLREVKETLSENLKDNLITVSEVIVTRLEFPSSYIEAKASLAMVTQELEAITEQTRVDQANALAQRKRADADNHLRITHAEADAKLQKIQTSLEKERRAAAIARARTDAEVADIEATTESNRRQILARSELQSKRELKNLELEKRKEIEELNLQMKEKAEQLAFEKELMLAQLCTDNPVYASYMVNKELAGQVEIAVLPTDTSPNVFKDLLHHNMVSPKKPVQGPTKP